MRKFLTALLTCVFLLGNGLSAGEEARREVLASGEASVAAVRQETVNTIANLVATDALGREIQPASDPVSGRLVGMFYFAWNGQHKDGQKGIYDIDKLLEQFGNTVDNPLWNKDETGLISPDNEFHYWGEPLYGYYDNRDPYVVRRHVELLTLSGIDYLALDVTNAVTYDEVWEVLFEVLDEYAQQGWDVPKIVFYCNTQTKQTVEYLYREIYSQGRYRHLWLYDTEVPESGVVYSDNRGNTITMQRGKPVIIGNVQPVNADGTRDYGPNLFDLSDEIKSFFSLRPNAMPVENAAAVPYAVKWLDWTYPQQIAPGGITSVSVAQHGDHPMSRSLNPYLTDKYNPSASNGYRVNWGRGFLHDIVSGQERGTNDLSRAEAGTNFQQQWNTVFSNDVNHVFLTGWNEWIVQKYYGFGGGENADVYGFVDLFNMEFSRDIEMMKGGYGDNFYLQNMANVRAFTYAGTEQAVHGPSASPELSSAFPAGQVYCDFVGDAVQRNFTGAALGSENYVDNSARNDIERITVLHDGQSLWFEVTTADPLTEYVTGDRSYLNLFLNCDGDATNGFSGYDYVVNRYPEGTLCSLEKIVAPGISYIVGFVETFREGNRIAFRIPMEALNLAGDFQVDFKVSDHVTNGWDIMDYYVTGDSAPIGRLSYRYAGSV